MAELTYEVTFLGAASDVLRAAFDDCGIESAEGRTTVRCGQDALPAVLSRIQDLGLQLVDVASSQEPTSTD